MEKIISSVIENERGAAAGAIEMKNLDISAITSKPKPKAKQHKVKQGITALPLKVGFLF